MRCALSQGPEPDFRSAPGMSEDLGSLAQRAAETRAPLVFGLHPSAVRRCPPVSAGVCCWLQPLGPGALVKLCHLVFTSSRSTTVSESRALNSSKTSTTIGIRAHTNRQQDGNGRVRYGCFERKGAIPPRHGGFDSRPKRSTN